MLTTALVTGIVVNILLYEITGLAAGGIISSGYVALILDQPIQLAILAALVAVTFGAMRTLSQVMILYGARRLGLTVLVGVALSTGAQHVRFEAGPTLIEWGGLGYIVPGLIAYHWERQGLLPTLAMLAIAAPLVRLITLLVTPW
jgi:poly-gamma-glutamate biosynthesis protein PgsC/CapC